MGSIALWYCKVADLTLLVSIFSGGYPIEFSGGYPIENTCQRVVTYWDVYNINIQVSDSTQHPPKHCIGWSAK